MLSILAGTLRITSCERRSNAFVFIQLCNDVQMTTKTQTKIRIAYHNSIVRLLSPKPIAIRTFCRNGLAVQQLKTFGRFPQSMTLVTSAQLHAPVTLKVVKPSNIESLPYEEKNALLKREQSPHLTIYKPQLTSMLSITHRGTGQYIVIRTKIVKFLSEF